ncbi:MAG: hypothetical protein QM723_01645 [Myxococcaceae bacterium]
MRSSVVLLLMCGCASMAINAAPKKQANPVQSDFSLQANEHFWAALHGGRYEELPDVIEHLQRAYVTDPTDAKSAAHLGFAHIWRVSERARSTERRAVITQDLVLSEYYFHDAVEMTQDPRFEGFLAGSQLAVGTVFKSERKVREGYFRMKDAVSRFPEFNLFARSYSAVTQPVDSERFKQGLADFWANIDYCLDGKLDHAHPDYAPLMSLATTTGPKRVCWNGWIAPHNHEGFALAFGDLLVKAGQLEQAKVMYANAKLSSTYALWPFREVLEKRLEQIDENAQLFRQPEDQIPVERKTMFASTMNCVGCHQGDVPSAPNPP